MGLEEEYSDNTRHLPVTRGLLVVVVAAAVCGAFRV